MNVIFFRVITCFTGEMKDRSFKTARAISALIVREMATTYGRSPGGYLWAVLEPVAGIAILSAVFSLALRSPPIGTNFPAYYATGILPFMFYKDIELKTAVAIKFSKALLGYPSVVYVDALLARLVLNTITQVMVFVLVMAGIALFFDSRIQPNLPLIISSLSMAAALGFGIGSLNCFLISVLPIWERVWAVLNRPLVFVSGVLFLHESVPEPWQTYLWYNPLVHIVGQMRRGFFPTYVGDYVEPMFPFGLALVTTALALLLLNRFNRDILNQI